MEKTISAIEADSYLQSEMDTVVGRHFDALRVDEIIKPGMKVCLKPNLLMKKSSDAAITTHPALVAAVIKKLKAMGVSDIVIAESPGGPFTKPALEGIFRGTGIEAAAVQNDAVLSYDTSYSSKRVENALTCHEFNIINAILSADAVINLPKLKTHGMVMLSAAVKNLYGCVPGLQKPEMHFRFDDKNEFCKMLLDLSRLVTPALTIVDAVDSMEGNGPSAGEKRHTGMTFAARNIYSLDLGLCYYLGIPSDNVLTVKNAIIEGMCPESADEIEWLHVKPVPLHDFKMPDSRPHDFSQRLPRILKKPAKAILTRFFSSRPVIIKDKCIGCGKCAESCAPKAVVVINGKARISYKKCIKCFCCHEMCPVRAIKIKG